MPYAGRVDSVRVHGLVQTSRADSDSDDETLASNLHAKANRIQRSSERFCIKRVLARGGLGQVSVVHDAARCENVALKEIRYEFADDPTCRCRFMQEAEISQSLDHPNIIKVFDIGSYSDGRPFYTMPLIAGQTLKVAIQNLHETARRTKSGREFTSLLRNLIAACEAIDYAHATGVVHRDVKPSNIMLSGGHTTVVDWGLATRLAEQRDAYASNEDLSGHAQVNSGSVSRKPIGTPAYMSPEQALGNSSVVTSDVFGLGATLYHVLTGKPPHSERTPSSLTNIERARFIRPRRVDQNIPADLEQICLKAMARNPRKRYGSAAALADDLRRWLDRPNLAGARKNVFLRIFGR